MPNDERAESIVTAERRARGRVIMQRLTGSAEQTAGLLGGLSPDYLEWVEEFALGQVWARPGLDLRTRSLCTVAALTVLGRIDNLKTHIRGALGNGATRDEVIETILHMTIYGGFPDAWDGLAAARAVFEDLDERGEDDLTTPIAPGHDHIVMTESDDGAGYERGADLGPVG